MQHLFAVVALVLIAVGGAVVEGAMYGAGKNNPRAAASCSAPDDVGAVRRLVESQFATLKPEALIFGWYERGSPVLRTAQGFAAPSVPATIDDHWRIGGITEPMLSTLYFILLEKGLLNTSQKLSDLYPNIYDADKVTLHNLAQNSAGYNDYARSPQFGNDFLSSPYRVFTPEELVSYATVNNSMAYEPGMGQAYSHTDMLLFYRMLEFQTGRTIADLFEEYIFTPLGLDNTRSPAPGDNNVSPDPILHAYSATLGTTLYESTNWSTSWFQGYGIVTSTIDDLGKWGNAFCTHALISNASFQTQIAYQGYGAENPHFGYGIVVDNGWFLENPSLNGYYGAWACNPETGVTIVVVSTVNDQTADVANVAFLTLEAVVKLISPNDYIYIPPHAK